MPRIHLALSLRQHLLLVGMLATATPLKLLSVQVPQVATEGESVQLNCTYDLEGDSPYTTAWFRDGEIFYRFLRSEGVVYPLPGVHVNLEQSNATSVRLENVTQATRGVYSCEVSSDAPQFRTVAGSAQTSVIEEAAASHTGDLRLISVDVPPNALLGGRVKLQCHFKLGEDELYSVKWYKGKLEFFRYVPGDFPPQKVFRLPGVTVNVSESDATSVLLERLDLSSAGTYRCEVYSGAPSFKVVAGEGMLNVTALKKEGPRIRGVKTHYGIGEAADIHCHSPEPSPAVNFTWFLNDITAEPPNFEISNLAMLHDDGHESSVSRIRFTISEGQFLNGRASIKCVATIPEVYTMADETIIRLKYDRAESVDPRKPTTFTDDECLSKLISVIRKVWASYQ